MVEYPIAALIALSLTGGVTTGARSSFNSNDVPATVTHPDPSSGSASSSEQDVATVNALGEPLTRTDRNGSVHTYSYDVLGRVISDAVTTLGSGVDGSVRRIEYGYDGQGNVNLLTSYNASSGGSIVNQVQRDVNGLGQITSDWQSHSGAVSGSSPRVQYAYSEMASGVNHSRPTTTTYPNGKVLTANYNTGLDSNISRLTSLSDTSGTLESYDYLGVNTTVRRAHSQPGVDLTYIKQSGESDGDAGDKYSGLDRFGRVVDQRWIKTSTGTATDRFQYGYDRESKPLWRDNLLNTAFGELYAYDNLSQQTSWSRGTLNGTKTGLTGSASRSQGWDFDAPGNFDSQTTNGTAVTRAHNKQNEITSVTGATTPTYDNNGNLTKDQVGQQYKFDAWDRLVEVKNSGGTVIASFAYDALNRRISETRSGTTTDLFYSIDWQVLEERVGSGVKAQYIWSPIYVDALILRDRDTDANGTLDERLWAQQDANWNVTALLDSSGNVVERFTYDSFGALTVYDASYNVRGSGSSYAWTYHWQGLRLDVVTALYHARMRDVHSVLGRPLQQDPLGFGAGDANVYRWEGNRTGAVTDPSGLAWVKPDDSAQGFVMPNGDEEALFHERRFKRVGVKKGSEFLVIVIAGDDLDWINVEAYMWHMKKASLDSINPFGRPMITIRAADLKTAKVKIDSRLAEGDTIGELRIVGHHGQSEFFFNDSSKLWWLATREVKLIRFNTCYEARKRKTMTKLANLSGAEVMGNSGGFAVCPNGNWYTIMPDGTSYKSNDYGDAILRQIGAVFYFIAGSDPNARRRPKNPLWED